MQMTTWRDVDAPSDVVFDLLADYWRRPTLLPGNVTDYGIKRGGQGGGTRVRYRLHAGGRVWDCRLEISEPTAGRELLETDTASSLVTRWTVEPRGPARTRVTVRTCWAGPGGIGGWAERVLATRRLRRLHTHSLDRLAHQAPT